MEKKEVVFNEDHKEKEEKYTVHHYRDFLREFENDQEKIKMVKTILQQKIQARVKIEMGTGKRWPVTAASSAVSLLRNSKA